MAKNVSDLLASAASIQKMGQAMLDAADAIAILDGKDAALSALERKIQAAQKGLADINGAVVAAQEKCAALADDGKAIIAKAHGEAADIRAKIEAQAKDSQRSINDELAKATRRLADLTTAIKAQEAEEAAVANRVAAAAKQEADILTRIKEQKAKLLKALEA